MEQDSNYKIKIKQFEGPFDLLLFFIERDEIDILDIPIAKITDDFLAYIRGLEEMNIDVASEFILMAATLMRIKAKMLLPRQELDEEGQEVDPREELTQKLLEYKRFKDILSELAAMEKARSLQVTRGNQPQELKSIASKALVDVELENLSLYKLMTAFERVMRRMEQRQKRPNHVVYKYDYSIEDQREHVLSKVESRDKVDFVHVFDGLQDRLQCIITFLAILELINEAVISIISGEGVNSFVLQKMEDAPGDMAINTLNNP